MAFTADEALAELARCTRSQFDHQVVTVPTRLYGQVFRNKEAIPPGAP